MIARILCTLLIAVAAGLGGCATMPSPTSGSGSRYSGGAYLAAYGATTVYLTEKESVDPELKLAIELCWEVFHSGMLAIDENNFSNIEQLLLDEMNKRLDGTTAAYTALALRVFGTYIDRVKQRYDFSAMQQHEAYSVVRAVHDGIEDSLSDYKAVNDALPGAAP